MALLAGLAAQVAPTAARVSEDTQIGAAVSARTLERQAAVLATTAIPHQVQIHELAIKAIQPARGTPALVLAAVLIGIDRTRE